MEATELTELAFSSKKHWNYSDEQIMAWSSGLTITPEFIAQYLVFRFEVSGKLAAFYALATRGENEFELEHCWVSPGHIGQGIGRMIFDHIKQQMTRAGVKTLRIVSDPNARGFYEKIGAVYQGEHLSPVSGRYLPALLLHLV